MKHDGDLPCFWLARAVDFSRVRCNLEMQIQGIQKGVRKIGPCAGLESGGFVWAMKATGPPTYSNRGPDAIPMPFEGL